MSGTFLKTAGSPNNAPKPSLTTPKVSLVPPAKPTDTTHTNETAAAETDAEGNYNQALTQIASHDYIGAEKSLFKALKISPTEPAYLQTLGRIYFDLGAYDKALEPLYQALRLSPELREDDALRFDYALCLAKLNPPELYGALKELNTACYLNPNNPDHYVLRAQIHAALKNPSAAQSDTEQVIAMLKKPIA